MPPIKLLLRQGVWGRELLVEGPRRQKEGAQLPPWKDVKVHHCTHQTDPD